MKHINTLTGLRGIAAFIVFLSHGANQGMVPAIFGNGLGQIGVMLFFILSGFLMAYLYLQKPFTKENARRYILARVGRIFPLYYLLIIASVVISGWIYHDFHYAISSPMTIARALLFIDAPFEFWTIPVEVQFYGIFILFWWAYQNNKSIGLLAAIIIFSAGPSVLYFYKTGNVPFLFSTYAYPFFVGVLTALSYKTLNNTQWLQTWAYYLSIPLLLLLALNLPALRLESGWILSNNFYLRTWLDPINWLLVYAIFICAMLNTASLQFLNTRPFVFLGDISFGFYLMHYPILKLVKLLPLLPFVQFIASFMITALLAWLSYRFFESGLSNKIRHC